MTRTLEIIDAEKKLHELLPLMADDEIIITQNQKPLARILPFKKQRKAGLHLGAMEASKDFDEELPEDFWLGSK